MTQQEINKQFDKQIKKGLKLSIIDKELFNLTYNFNKEDWINIHSEAYFKEIENYLYLDNLNQTNYIFWNRRNLLLRIVKKYIKTNNINP